MGRLKCNHIKQMIALTSDYIKRLSLNYATTDKSWKEVSVFRSYHSISTNIPHLAIFCLASAAAEIMILPIIPSNG
jgi:hypothetical protein